MDRADALARLKLLVGCDLVDLGTKHSSPRNFNARARAAAAKVTEQAAKDEIDRCLNDAATA